MSKACIVPFFRYEPSARGSYKVLFKYFLKHLKIWSKEIDHLYFIDSGDCLDASDKEQLNLIVKNTVYNPGISSHWHNLNKHIPLIKEDMFMLIDSDTIISSAEVVNNIFKQLHNFDIVSMTDGSGGVDLFKNFSAFAANEFRDVRRRFAPYLFACKTDLFKRIGPFDFTPATGTNWTDSMGTVTRQLLTLDPKILELPDDRGSIYYIDGKHQSAPFLDGPQFKWSQNIPNDYGYYHVRNFNGGLYLVETKALNKSAYDHARSIMPRQEAFRLLGWLWTMTDSDAYRNEIISVANDFAVDQKSFVEYIDAFSNFHSWLSKVH